MSVEYPAGISATTLKVRVDADVALATSLAIMAKPSTDELSNGGRSDEMMSAASTRPAQALREDISVSTGLKWERMRCCASRTLSRLMAKAGALYHALLCTLICKCLSAQLYLMHALLSGFFCVKFL